MKVATFNCNSVRVRLPIILDWLAEHDPDLLALQETKVEDHQFPRAEFEELGWHCACHGRKSYNGVAFISKRPTKNLNVGFPDLGLGEDHRVMRADFGDITIVNTYVPNGSTVGSDKFEYKLRWLREFSRYIANLTSTKDVIWMGDINIAPTKDDVFDPSKHYGMVGFHPGEIALLGEISGCGLEDMFRKFYEGPGHYSFWEFYLPKAFERNLGWRIDHIYATRQLAERCTACEIDKAPRQAERPSDHTFVWAEFDSP